MDGTKFSMGEPSVPHGQTSISIRFVSSLTSKPAHDTPQRRNQFMQSPGENKQTIVMDLSLYTEARLRDLPLRTLHYGNGARTAELL